MADYWGLVAISSRMGWRSKDTPVKQKLSNNFLMYRRRKGSDPRWRWYTHDGLIQAWEISMCQAQREGMLARQTARNEHSQAPEKSPYTSKVAPPSHPPDRIPPS